MMRPHKAMSKSAKTMPCTVLRLHAIQASRPMHHTRCGPSACKGGIGTMLASRLGFE
jgi:hypothetical protein